MAPVGVWGERTETTIRNAPVPGSLSRVVDRPDRRMQWWLRARSFSDRTSRQGSTLLAARRLGSEWLDAWLSDARERQGRQPRVIRSQVGDAGLSRSPSVAVYIHYAPVSAVSSMVLDQLDAYRALGFHILFVSMAPDLPATILSHLSSQSVSVLQRRNVGLDFGAWQDALTLLAPHLASIDELLLVNDSVCGPLRPLTPLVQDMRRAGNGLFGMTESLAPTPHLQSYFLLARGQAAIADVVQFLVRYRQTAYKRNVVRHGEIALTRWMRSRGHVVSARFGYQDVEDAALLHLRSRRRLRRMFPSLFAGVADDNVAEFVGRLRGHPLNPTHALWQELVEHHSFPFLKTKLLTGDPASIDDLHGWRALVPSHLPGLGQAIEAHLAIMRTAFSTR